MATPLISRKGTWLAGLLLAGGAVLTWLMFDAGQQRAGGAIPAVAAPFASRVGPVSWVGPMVAPPVFEWSGPAAMALAARQRAYLAWYRGLSGQLPPDSRLRRPVGPIESAPGGRGPRVRTSIDKAFVVAGENVGIRATIEEGPGAEAVVVSTRLAPLRAPERTLVLPMSRQSDAGGTEFTVELASDHPGLHLIPTEISSIPPPLEVEYVVTATGKRDGKVVARGAAGVLVINRPGATLRSDSAQIRRQDNDLVLDIAVDVASLGRYWIFAELWGGLKGSGRWRSDAVCSGHSPREGTALRCCSVGSSYET